MTPILIFSMRTRIGVFEVRTEATTFEITPHTYGCRYTLHLTTFPEFKREFECPYMAIRAVAGHDSGFPAWDCADELVSDYAPDWNRHLDKKIKIQLLGNYLSRRPHSSYRECIDYFHFKHPYVLNRMEIHDLLEELAVTGQLDKPLDDHMVPSELRQLADVIKKWHQHGDTANE